MGVGGIHTQNVVAIANPIWTVEVFTVFQGVVNAKAVNNFTVWLLYTSPSPRDS